MALEDVGVVLRDERAIDGTSPARENEFFRARRLRIMKENILRFGKNCTCKDFSIDYDMCS
jgi:hypothetical protein